MNYSTLRHRTKRLSKNEHERERPLLKVFTLRKSYVKISETDRTVCFTHETQVTTVLPYSTERERERRAEEERQAQRQAQLKRKRDRLRERDTHTQRENKTNR